MYIVYELYYIQINTDVMELEIVCVVILQCFKMGACYTQFIMTRPKYALRLIDFFACVFYTCSMFVAPAAFSS